MSGSSLLYSQGQTATFMAQFVTSPAGMPVDVPNATVSVILGDEIFLNPTPMLPTLAIPGLYYYDWPIPNSLPVNNYTIRYTGTVQGTDTATTDTLVVVAAGTPTTGSITQKVAELIAALETYISCAQNMPVYREVGRRNKSRDIYQFTYPRWNLGNHAVFLNDEIITDGFVINTDTGTITFETPRLDSDRVDASYNFRMFTQQDLVRFLADALSQINVQPPGTAYTLETLPSTFVGVLMLGASKNAMKKLMFCLNFQEMAMIFGGKEEAKQAIDSFNTLKENNEKEFIEEKKNLKIARYPSVGIISEPAYTLPGGRSRWFRYLYSGSV